MAQSSEDDDEMIAVLMLPHQRAGFEAWLATKDCMLSGPIPGLDDDVPHYCVTPTDDAIRRHEARQRVLDQIIAEYEAEHGPITEEEMRELWNAP